MGIRAKFNLLMLAVAAAGAGLFALAADPLVDAIAREEVLQRARLIMDGAAGARKYTAEQITPLLKERMAHEFYPQAVAAYGAKRAIDVIEERYPDYTYREAALNPTNPQDRASDWEADIINEFRANPSRSEIALERVTPAGRFIGLARPLAAKKACLECHGSPAKAPRSMVAIYGDQHGFGWKLNEVSAAQVVSVPIQASAMRAAHIRKLFVLPFACLIAVMYLTVNLLLHFVVIRPIERIAAAAEAVSMGDIEAPEYHYGAKDEIGRLSQSFTRMHRSMVEAFHLLRQA